MAVEAQARRKCSNLRGLIRTLPPGFRSIETDVPQG